MMVCYNCYMKDKSVLVINCGSSSIKYQLIIPQTEEVLATGLVERIGQNVSDITHKVNGESFSLQTEMKDHKQGLQNVVNMFEKYGPNLNESGICAVGHRVVQGGQLYKNAVVIDDEVLNNIKDLSELAPLHNPANATGIEVAMEMFDVKNVAVFDTAFFYDLPKEASTYAIDLDICKKSKIKRYGMHGTSHKYVGNKVKDFLKGDNDFKQIVLHLGNGASASAQIGTTPIETSMGLTPLQGLVMGTRSGDIDPAIIFHLVKTSGMSIDEIDNLLNKKSGVYGIASVTDMRDLRELVESGDEKGKLALDVYIHRLVFYIGAYHAILGGLDAITFTAGIGENADWLRKLVCEKLSGLGIKIDNSLNEIRSSDPRIISSTDSNIKVLVCPTNEELAIAQEAYNLL